MTNNSVKYEVLVKQYLPAFLVMWRRSGLVVSASDFQPEGRWFEPDLCHCVVSLDKKLCSTLALSTQVLNGYRRHNAGG